MNPDPSTSSIPEDLRIRQTVLGTLANDGHIPCSDLLHRVQKRTRSSALQIAVIIEDLIREKVLTPSLFKGMDVLNLVPQKPLLSE